MSKPKLPKGGEGVIIHAADGGNVLSSEEDRCEGKNRQVSRADRCKSHKEGWRRIRYKASCRLPPNLSMANDPQPTLELLAAYQRVVDEQLLAPHSYLASGDVLRPNAWAYAGSRSA